MNNALFTNLDVICVMQIMLDIHGDTCFQRIEGHKHSAIGKHLCDAHNQRNKDLQKHSPFSRNAVESWNA